MTFKPKILSTLILNGTLPNSYEIKQSNRWDMIDLNGSFGGVQKSDIGKIIKFINGTLYMENTEQMNIRRGNI